MTSSRSRDCGEGACAPTIPCPAARSALPSAAPTRPAEMMPIPMRPVEFSMSTILATASDNSFLPPVRPHRPIRTRAPSAGPAPNANRATAS